MGLAEWGFLRPFSFSFLVYAFATFTLGIAANVEPQPHVLSAKLPGYATVHTEASVYTRVSRPISKEFEESASNKSAAWRNMFTPTRNVAFKMKRRGDVVVNADNWEQMGKIERFLSLGYSLQDLNRIISKSEKASWEQVAHAIRHEYSEGECETSYNVLSDQWTSCCLLESANPKKTIGFCASHVSVGLPDLCRPPIAGFDFKSSMGKYEKNSAVPPDRWNVRMWMCDTELDKAKKENEPFSSDKFILSERAIQFQGEFFFEVYDLTRQADPCAISKNIYVLPCYSACCNNFAMSTSPFCSLQSLTCY
jgi:hypothetical protein